MIDQEAIDQDEAKDKALGTQVMDIAYERSRWLVAILDTTIVTQDQIKVLDSIPSLEKGVGDGGIYRVVKRKEYGFGGKEKAGGKGKRRVEEKGKGEDGGKEKKEEYEEEGEEEEEEEKEEEEEEEEEEDNEERNY